MKNFFKINNLDLEIWPKANEFSGSALIEENENSDSETDALKSNSAASFANIHALSNSSFVNENVPMTVSMAAAKNLLDEVKDPLCINDSLYQYKK